MRLFKGRSKGIKGIQLNDKDKVISLSILDNSKIDTKTLSTDKKIKNAVDKFICLFQKMVTVKIFLLGLWWPIEAAKGL